MATNRIKVEGKDSDGNDVVIFAQRPTADETAKAQMSANKAFKQALKAGAMVRKTLEDELESQGIWNDEKQKKLEGYNEDIQEHLLAIKSGGIKLKDGCDHAIKVRIARMEALALQSERNEYDGYTAESQAEAAKIDSFCAQCLKNEKGESFFETEEEYLENSAEPYVNSAANKLVTMIYGMEESWESELPENKFLRKYKFVDDDLRLINKDGNYVTIDGKEINENFQYVDPDGNITDSDGNRIDEDGLPVVEVMPFLDDDGNPIIEEEEDPVSDESTE